jgi:large subunit ribosomal protein L9
MKVILLRDVAKIGRRYQVVDVPDGFALNKLIPRKDAEPATPATLKRVEHLKERDKSGKEGIAVAIKKIVADLSENTLFVPMQANEQGHLFQSVHADDVVNAAKVAGVKIPKEYIHFETPIKSVGNHSITLKSQNEGATLTINVIAK